MITFKQQQTTKLSAPGIKAATSLPKSRKVKKGKQQKSQSNLDCMIDCGHDDHPPADTQQPVASDAKNIPIPGLKSADELDEKNLTKLLEAGLAINGLKVLLMATAEKIELHVNHNAITPELLTELDDVAKSIFITTKKLNAIKTPCCDLYVPLAVQLEDE